MSPESCAAPCGASTFAVTLRDGITRIRPRSDNAGAHGFLYVQDADLYNQLDEMVDKDTNIAFVLKKIVAHLVKCEERFELVENNTTEAQERRKYVEESILNIPSDHNWSAFKRNSIKGKLMHGFSVHEKIWLPGEGKVKLTHLIHRHPGQFSFDELGNLLFMNPLDNGKWMLADTRKFCVYREMGMYGNPFGEAEIRVLRYLYWFKKEAFKAWVEYCETYGTPLAVAKVPEGLTVVDKVISDLKKLLGNLRKQHALILAHGEDITFEQRASSSGMNPHAFLIDWITREQVKVMLGAVLNTTESSNGGAGASRASAQVHSKESGEMMRMYGPSFSECVTRQLCGDIERMNFASAKGKKPTRYIADMDDRFDVQQMIELIDAASQRWQLELEKAQVYEWTGFRRPKEGTPKEDLIQAVPAASKVSNDAKPNDPPDLTKPSGNSAKEAELATS